MIIFAAVGLLENGGIHLLGICETIHAAMRVVDLLRSSPDACENYQIQQWSGTQMKVVAITGRCENP